MTTTNTSSSSTKLEEPAVDAACVLMINDEGLVLMVSRKDNHNIWGLPGGKREAQDVEPVDIAVRELKEETGYAVKPHNLLSIYKGYYRTAYVETFLCIGNTGYGAVPEKAHYRAEPEPGEGLVRWGTYKEILAEPFGEYNSAVLTNYLALSCHVAHRFVGA